MADGIAGEQISSHAAYRQAMKLRVSGIIRELQVFRRMLRAAVEWGVVERAEKVNALPEG